LQLKPTTDLLFPHTPGQRTPCWCRAHGCVPCLSPSHHAPRTLPSPYLAPRCMHAPRTHAHHLLRTTHCLHCYTHTHATHACTPHLPHCLLSHHLTLCLLLHCLPACCTPPAAHTLTLTSLLHTLGPWLHYYTFHASHCHLHRLHFCLFAFFCPGIDRLNHLMGGYRNQAGLGPLLSR